MENWVKYQDFLVLLAHEKALTKQIDVQSVVEAFAMRKSRRVPLL